MTPVGQSSPVRGPNVAANSQPAPRNDAEHPANDGTPPSVATPATSDADELPFTQGFGPLLQQENALQHALDEALQQLAESSSAKLTRILRHQRTRTAAGIALLVARCETLPSPERFREWGDQRSPLSPLAPVASNPPTLPTASLLADLVARHLNLVERLGALTDHGPEGVRGHLVLTELARGHDDMAWMLTALLKEDTARASPPATGAPDKPKTEASWENEGGALKPPAPPPGPAPNRS